MASKNPADDRYTQVGLTPINAAKAAYWVAADTPEVFSKKHQEDLARFKARVDGWREAAKVATGHEPSLDESLAAVIDIAALTKAIAEGDKAGGDYRQIIDIVVGAGRQS